MDMVNQVAKDITELEYRLMEAFFPGPFTIILKKKDIVPNIVTAGHEQTTELMAALMPEQGTKEELDFINVVKYVTKDFPPAFIMTANDDFLRAEAPRLAAKLVEELVPFTMSFYGTSDKPLWHVFHCDMRLEEAKCCNDDECDFFRRFL